MKRLIVVFGIMSLTVVPYAQQEDINGGPVNSRTETGVIDGVYLSTHIPTKRLIPYEFVREADVIWSKRVWRTIDLREKINHPLYYPLDEINDEGWYRNDMRWSLWTIIRHHILTGDLTVYSPYHPINFNRFDGDQFKYPILPEPGKDFYTDSLYAHKLKEEYLAQLGPKPTVPLQTIYFEDSIGPDGQPVYPDREVYWFESKKIKQYRLKEDWFFDKERSVLDVRILGLAPVIYDEDSETGAITGTRELFWLYFPTDCRYVFNNYFVYNEKNDSRWMSFDDYFMKRRFNSFIHKEENKYERDIDKYKTGVDALMESKKIHEEIRLIEHDVWSF